MISILIVTLLATAPIRLVCPESSPKAVRIDGILDEWDEMTPFSLDKRNDVVRGGDKISSASDLGVSIRCTTAKGEGIYFLVEVNDSRIIRSKRPSKNDDHIEISFMKSSNRVYFYPPSDKSKGLYKNLPKGSKAKVVKRENGYAVEFGIVWGKYGITEGLPHIPFSIAIYDTDSSVSGKPETVMALDKMEKFKMTKLEFGAARAMYNNLLDRLNVSESDMKLKKLGNFVWGKALEQAFWVDRYLVVMGGDIGGNFVYTGLGAAASNVVMFKIIDVDGDKIDEFVTENTFGNGTSQWKMMAVWKASSRGIRKIFAHLIEFKSGPHIIQNSYKLVKNGKRYKAVFKFVKTSKSITQKNWKGSTPDKETIDFLFPWTKKKETFKFSGGSYSGGR
ncbi:MAG: hypothetical protein JXR95_10160 [Deltaproteobacteria bacterium]|nr:hypothetical protein [Deltaproteobacteria bacterium]